MRKIHAPARPAVLAVLATAAVIATAAAGDAAAATHHGTTVTPVTPVTPVTTGDPVTPPTPPNAAAISVRVNQLLSEMTVKEKFGQLEMSGPTGKDGGPGKTLLREARDGTVGSVLDMVGVKNINALQHAAMASRLHIPIIAALDVIHGYKTIFPVPLGEASSWNPSLVEHDESVSASEATADGLKWTFNPMVDITRDPRWGRVVEGSGEDPYLGSAMAAAKVRGYQGDNFAAPDKMAATVKHFAAYGAPVAGREYNTVDMSTQSLFNDYLPPYQAAVDAGVATVMPSLNSLNGVPNTANPYTLQTILRQEWGFTGVTVSDYQAVQELEDFGFAVNQAAAARLALTAGVDIEMAVTIPSKYSTYDNAGPRDLAAGTITLDQLNAAVTHVLTLKYLAGMFAHPYTDPNRVKHAELTAANLAAARHSADESMTLLNDRDHALPLSRHLKRIAVVGPLADDAYAQLGADVPIGYNLAQGKVVSVLDGIRQAVPRLGVTYAQGCGPMCTSTRGFGRAVAAAKGAQETVIVVGEPSSESGEATSLTNLDLPGRQLALIKAVAATGTPYVVVLINGRPLTIPWLADHAPGLLEAWYPGTEGGPAVADALFGRIDPSGKLPMTFPRDVGQIPIYYNQLPTGRPRQAKNKYTSRYLDTPNTPQYPFGYGLSYTTFRFSPVTLSARSIGLNGTLTASTRITNTGTRRGTDVAQLYVHEFDTPILQPVRKLEGFARVTLGAGKSTTVTFPLGPSNLGSYDDTGQFGVNPGTVEVWVGDSSTGGRRAFFGLG